MNYTCLLFVGTTLLMSCKEKQSITITETRELTSADTKVDLSVTTPDQFAPKSDTFNGVSSDAAPTNTEANKIFTYDTPPGWQEAKSTMFRAVNMTFGESGEAYVSIVGGDLLGNINRWFGQFKEPKIDSAQLSSLDPITISGNTGYLVTASGTYNPGMGRPGQENVMLLAAIAESQSKLITVKLIAPISEAESQKEAFISFCRSLKQN